MLGLGIELGGVRVSGQVYKVNSGIYLVEYVREYKGKIACYYGELSMIEYWLFDEVWEDIGLDLICLREI